MYILGINPSIDASACLIDDKNIIFASSEERFNRIKHARTFPLQSIHSCLESKGKKLTDIDAIAISWNPGINIEHLNTLTGTNYRNYAELLIHIPFHLLKELKKQQNINSKVAYVMQEFMLENSNKPIKIYYLDHHLSHAAASFYISEFKNAAILTMDGYGEETSILFAIGQNNRIKPVKRFYFPHSLGSIYAAFTQYLGFTPNGDEGKVMGLAAWGKPIYYSELKKIVKFDSKKELEIDLTFFSYFMERQFRISSKFINKFGAVRLPDEPINEHHKNIACSLQKIIEDIACQLAHELYELSGEKNLCLAGGVALNCAMNGIMQKNTPFKNIFVPPYPGDDGNSLGSALYLKHNILGLLRQTYREKVFLGASYKDVKIEKILKNVKIKFISCENKEKKAAELLAQNKIIGWFQERMEFGPRALGNRSILAHPNGDNVKKRLDQGIKKRAEFRPYAPAILKEKYNLFFKDTPYSPYMSFCAKVNPEYKNRIKNVIHIDGTARVQVVESDISKSFYILISEFENLTGIPIVLNTSLNTFSEPIVNTPEEAIHLFFTTDLDAIFLGKYLLYKETIGDVV